jgi:hypothetical protein
MWGHSADWTTILPLIERCGNIVWTGQIFYPLYKDEKAVTLLKLKKN